MRVLVEMPFISPQPSSLADKELEAFVHYIAVLYRGESTTANHAATNYKVSAGTWQSWRNAMITMGLATEIGKQGGPGFELLAATRRKPWDDLEEYIRQNAPLSVRSAASPGMLITQAPAPVRGKRQIEAVSTLGADVDD